MSDRRNLHIACFFIGDRFCKNHPIDLCNNAHTILVNNLSRSVG
ncbi:hypothetical protein ACN23B_28505 (plasmid) [Anabaena sp. FACHB-709]